MQNQLQKINQENSQLLLEVESKLDFLVKGQERDSNKLESIEKQKKAAEATVSMFHIFEC